ncbi:MAG: rolling circle replication-associated protein [Fusobacteriaceae bacterium]
MLEKVIVSEIERKAIESMKKSVNRAKTKLRRLIEQNRGKYKQRDKFITLTIAENETNRKDTNYDFMKFIQRLKSRYLAFEYIAVLEKQKRGSIHYHVLFFGLPYIPSSELEKLWGKGFVRINVIDTYPELGKYLVKYLSKDLETGRATKQKRYFTSRGLHQPVEEYNVDSERIVANEDLKIQFIKEFGNEYVGKGAYVYCKKMI